MRIILLIILSVSLGSTDAVAQINLDQVLRGLDPEVASGYVAPAADDLAIGMHQAQYDTPCNKRGFHLSLGVTLARLTISEESWRFQAEVTQEGVTSDLDLPTIWGPDEGVSTNSESGTIFTYPGGLAQQHLLVAVPQLRIGTVHDFDIGVRYANYDYGSLLGKIKMQGLSIRYALVDTEPSTFGALSIMYDYSRIDVQEDLQVRGHSLGFMGGLQTPKLQVSGRLSFLLRTARLQYENLRGESIDTALLNTEHWIAGLSAGVKIWHFSVHGEFNIIPETSYGMGVHLFL